MSLIRCDGCDQSTDPLRLAIVSANGVQARYCLACVDDWQALEQACNAQAEMYQRLLQLFWQDARNKTLLKMTPLDLPDQTMRLRSNALVLG